MLHIACQIDGIQAEYYLNRTLSGRIVSIHHFRSLDELLTLAQRFSIDLVFLASGGAKGEDAMKLLDLVRLIKNHTYLAIIPTVLYHPRPDEHIITAAFENGAEEVFSETVPVHIAQVKLAMLMQRAVRDLSVNPSSRLPGPGIIEKEIERQIELGQQFAVCYADLDNFKAFNDYYGYYFGDRVIRLTARIIKDVVFDLCREGFVGHIGGDDYIFIIPSDMVPAICDHIIRTFDTLIPYRYQDDDRRRGYIITKNRRGVEEQYGIMTISIAVVINKGKMFQHIGEMSHMLADLKKYAKSVDGSTYVIERRRKY
jgi:GGDEF domain-containing protein